MTYSRECPGCRRRIEYNARRSYERANSRNSQCHGCGQVERQTIDGVPHKRCADCKGMKPYSSFNKLSRSIDGLQGYCQPCGRARGMTSYFLHKDGGVRRTKQRNEDLRARINNAKDVPCADCGIRFHPVCMDFDHLPEYEKSYNISTMLRHRMAWESIQAEIDKCEVVCANCHRYRTYTRSQDRRSDIRSGNF